MQEEKESRSWLYTPEVIRKSAEGRKTMIYGVGINDIPEYLRGSKLYVTWKSMFARCYNPRFHEKNPSYIGCSVDKRWHRLSDFKKWFDENYVEGYQLDKDILVKDNKVYGPETCCFVPEYINRIFRANVFKDSRKLAVRKQNRKYQARCRCGHSYQYASFDTFEEARNWFVSTRTKCMTEIANDYLYKELISAKVYNGLIRIANEN